MRVAYVTVYDSHDIESWSGLGSSIREALKHAGFEIQPIGPLSTPRNVPTAVRRLYWEKLAGKQFHDEREPSVLRSYAAQVSRGLAAMDCDVVFSPSTLPIAHLTTDLPIVFWADAVFDGMLDFYPSFSNLCGRTVRNGHRVEQSALDRCALAIYSSEWAASDALRHYHVDPGKVRVVPFGAITDGLRSAEEAAGVISSRSSSVCRLLFVGVDWKRKGGDFAVEVAECLLRRGVPVELHVAGCTPPRRLPDYVIVHGFISKRTADGAARLNRLFRDSHFLVHPSRAECYGLALAEASAFALPSMATAVGGTSSVIADGANGRLFRLDDAPQAYAASIESLFASRAAYDTLALTSFEEFSRRLNWSAAGRQVRQLLEQVTSTPQRAMAIAD